MRRELQFMQEDVFEEGFDEAKEPEADAVIEQIGRYLKNRDYFEFELILKLRRKDYSASEIERGLAFFKELGLLHDEELAFRYALGRLSKEGPNKVLARLLSKGLTPDTAKLALAKAMEETEVSQEERLAGLLQDMLNKMDVSLEELDYHTKQKLAKRLYNKGYPTSLIMKALKM